MGWLALVPTAEARELHGRERIDALRQFFDWHITRRDELQALRDELTERELVATVPMRFDPIYNTRPMPLEVPAWEVTR